MTCSYIMHQRAKSQRSSRVLPFKCENTKDFDPSLDLQKSIDYQSPSVLSVKRPSRRERDASVVWRLNCINKRFRRNRLILLRRSQLEHYLHHVSHEIPSEEQLLRVRPASPTIFLRPTFCRE